ncbi:MAG: pyruvate, phosphate dikinase [Kiritimatiellaeota bacterium]|nr:pyruvate, phosphate dikinase [Kiritimatiellota bacterium]
MAGTKFVYFFGGGSAEGNTSMKPLLGGKGANLAEMASIGIPVPPGFTISTEACKAYYDLSEEKLFELLRPEVETNLTRLEELTGKTFGKGPNPLLVSVRSGAAVSMPGMMDTVLNLGLNDETLEALAGLTGNRRFALDAYRRFIQMFGDVVMGIRAEDESGHEYNPLHRAMDEVKEKYGRGLDTDLTAEEMAEVVEACKATYKEYTGHDFPQDPKDQLWRGIAAVFGSWNNPRAVRYREINEIRNLIGTAVNVQTMVFGNMGADCGTGVAFTRHPGTGENRFFGEFLMNAQGEDVVAGIRTPEPIERLNDLLPEAYEELLGIRKRLEEHYRDMQDIEFTIEQKKLFMLQTRTGKRTGQAAVRIAVDMLAEGLITEPEALLRVPPNDLDQLLHPRFDPEAEKTVDVIAQGLPASPGAASGQVVFTAEEAEEWNARGEPVILCRIETSPEDVGGMHAAEGILTARGGMTSHAAVVARGWGKCCVAGAGGIAMDYGKGEFRAGDVVVKKGDWISLNGSTGAVYLGKLPTVDAKLTGPFGKLMELADKYRRLGVRTNSDTPQDTEVAVGFGAEGIGLTRTEHMFFEGDRIVSFRRLILVAEKVKEVKNRIAAVEDEKEAAAIREQNQDVLTQYNQALSELLPLQRQDFEGIFRALDGRPCTIRLLDPPLHEFLPHDEAGQQEMAETMEVPVETIRATVEALHEFNPMLGHRGCRLGLTYPEVSDMQVRAIIEAAVNVKRSGVDVEPEIMIPLVGKAEELKISRERAEQVIQKVFEEQSVDKDEIPYKIGTMIEIPRAAITADRIAEYAEFFSFGTNDLTQMGCGFSRDDAGKFLGEYVKMGIYEKDPFQVLDQEGVGKLVQMGVELGRKTCPNLKVGICGEHGGEPESVKFCHRIGLDYVSCSPYRVPIARLAAAQAVAEEKLGE